MRLILVRHPKPLCAPGLCYGRLDLPCEPQSLDLAAARLAKSAVGCRVATSPALRAQSLASRLASGVVVEPRLRELDFGDWEGRLWHDLGRDAIESWRKGLPSSAPPNGETLTAMAARLTCWLASLSGETDTLAVTHAGPIRVLRALLRNEPVLTYFEKSVPFAEPFILEIERGWRCDVEDR
jgi:alpha-ribazole phosphatase